MPGSLPLHLTITAASGKPLVPYLRRHLRAAHAVLKPPLSELSLALVGDATMSDLHERFMGVPGPTDVLTFPLDEDARGRATAGEVVVCVPEARRRAGAEGTDLRREVLLYALHGVLHLCGYDDRKPADFARMHRTEDQILTRIGIGAVFDTNDARPRPRSTARPRATAAEKTRVNRKKRPPTARFRLGTCGKSPGPV